MPRWAELVEVQITGDRQRSDTLRRENMCIPSNLITLDHLYSKRSKKQLMVLPNQMKMCA